MKEKITDFLFVVFKFVQNPKDKKQPKQQLSSPNLVWRFGSCHLHWMRHWVPHSWLRSFWNYCSYSNPRFLIGPTCTPTQMRAAPDSFWAIQTEDRAAHPLTQTLNSLTSTSCLLEWTQRGLTGPLLLHPTPLGALLCHFNGRPASHKHSVVTRWGVCSSSGIWLAEQP